MNPRQKYNMLILWKLFVYIRANPDQRFGQILRNIGVVKDFMADGEWTPRWTNHFNEEPKSILDRINETENEKDGR